MKTLYLNSTSSPDQHTAIHLHQITSIIIKSSGIVVLVGAGISTSAGIPDFRSSVTGLYSPSTSPSPSSSKASREPSLKTLFTSSVLSSPALLAAHFKTLSTFHSHHLLSSSSSNQPTKTHEFISLLNKRDKLIRAYSQNIDGLEAVSPIGLKVERIEGCFATDDPTPVRIDVKGKGKERERGTLVQLHGSLRHVKCTKCSWVGNWLPSHTESFSQGLSQDCPGCLEEAEIRLLSSKRSIPIKSYLRPSIILYSEPPSPTSLSSSLSISQIASHDLTREKVQVVLVMGTSLKIPGFRNLVKEFAGRCKEGRETKGKKRGVVVFVNKEKAGKEWEGVFDYQIITETDTFSEYVTKEWKKSADWSANKQSKLSDFVGSSRSTKVGLTHPANKRISTPTKRTPLSPLPSLSNLDHILPFPLPPLTSSKVFTPSLPSTPPSATRLATLVSSSPSSTKMSRSCSERGQKRMRDSRFEVEVMVERKNENKKMKRAGTELAP